MAILSKIRSSAPDVSPDSTKSQKRSSKYKGCLRKLSLNGWPALISVPILFVSFFTDFFSAPEPIMSMA